MARPGSTSLSSHELLLFGFSADHRHVFTFIVFVHIVSELLNTHTKLSVP